MTEKLKPCPFCGGEVEILGINSANPFMIYCDNCGLEFGRDKEFYFYQVVEAWNTRAVDENPPSLTLILPARVGDFIVVKDGDSTETLRIDGFELRGDELTVWGEGENERYVDFAQHEIIRYIPREEDCND